MHITMTDTDVFMYALTFMTGLAIGLGNGNLFVGWDKILFAPARKGTNTEENSAHSEAEPDSDHEESADEADAEGEADAKPVDAEHVDGEAVEAVGDADVQVRSSWFSLIGKK